MNRIRNLLARVAAPEAAPPWTLMTAVLAVLFTFIAMIIGSGVVYVWANAQTYTTLAGWTLGGLLVIMFVLQTRRNDRQSLRLDPPKTPILFIMFVSLGLAIALDLVSLAVTSEFQVSPELLGLNPSALGVLEWGTAIAFMVIVQPIAEGLVFRGITLPAVRTLMGAWSSILVTAVITGAFHMLVYPPNYNTTSTITPIWYGLFIPVIEAILFSIVRNSTQSTRAAIAAQVAFGLFAVIKLLTLTGQG